MACEKLSPKSGSKERKQNKGETELLSFGKKYGYLLCEQQERGKEGARTLRNLSYKERG